MTEVTWRTRMPREQSGPLWVQRSWFLSQETCSLHSPRSCVLEKRLFNASFSKCFQEFRDH